MNSSLVSSWPAQNEIAALRKHAANLPAVTLNPCDLARLELSLGGYIDASKGFTAAPGTTPHWQFTLPQSAYAPGDCVVLLDPEGTPCAILTLADIVHGDTVDQAGGELQGVEQPQHPLYEHLRLAPPIAREQLAKHPAQNWIAVPVRQVLSRDNWDYLCQQATHLQAGLLLVVTDRLDRQHAMELRQRMAIAQIIVDELGKTLGKEQCRVLICPEADEASPAQTHATDAHIARHLGCQYLAVKSSASLPQCLDGVQLMPLDSTADPLATEHQYPRILQAMEAFTPAPGQRGFCVFLTGLSGSGKSTIARGLEAALLQQGQRPVSVLDGDIIRRHLSSELGFSKQHRDLNIRRIGYVASEIVKHRGIAICAPIAPYTQTRAAVREMIEHHGAFIEIHVATPIEVCEARDRKGLYAKARAGLIVEFTGVSDPYEAPQMPQLRLDTSEISCADCVNRIMACLRNLELWLPHSP